MSPQTTDFEGPVNSHSRREFLTRVASGMLGVGTAISLAGCADGGSAERVDGDDAGTDSTGESTPADLASQATDPATAPAAVSPSTLPPASGGSEFAAPPVIQSANGVLEATLTAAATTVPWGDGKRFALSYNDGVNGPTLVAHPGDLIKVRLINDLDEPTNLHTHGLHTSPDGNGDNPFRVVEPGASFDYEFAIPADHPTGTFWYHPHHHGMVAPQVHGGLAGALLITDPNSMATGDENGRALTERVLIVTDPTAAADAAGLAVSESERQNGREGNAIVVNGQVGPAATVRPGSVEHWRIINACVSRYHELTVNVDGQGVDFAMIGTDQGHLPEPISQRSHILVPGQRVEMRIPVPETATNLELISTPVGRGTAHTAEMGGMSSPAAVDAGPTMLLQLRADSNAVTDASSGSATTGPAGGTPVSAAGTDDSMGPADSVQTTAPGTPSAESGPGESGTASTESAATQSVPATAGQSDDLAGLVTKRREIQLGAMAMGPDEFVIDGKTFDPDRVDIEVAAGSVEEWTIGNGSMMNHPFHIHVWPFQVVSRSGAEPDPGWRDVVDIAAGETVTIRIDFRSMTGKSVYHCHILDHEDFGMMGIVNVA